jgi:hypothetical protein
MSQLSIGIRGVTIAIAAALLGCSSPSKLEAIPNSVVLHGLGTTKKIEIEVYDSSEDLVDEDLKFVWFSTDTKIIRLDQDGTVEGIASGEAEVEIEVIGTDLKTTVPVRVKNATSIKVSHEKLRLWTGQVKIDVWAEVHSEKGAFIEGYLPNWNSDDPTVVKVEARNDVRRRQSWVKLTGLKSGTTYINAVFKNLTKTIKVSVFDEDEEVELDGTRIPKKKK